jgi:hypothetical protein
MQRFSVPRRLALVGAIAVGAFALVGALAAAGGSGAQAAKADAYTAPLCVQHSTLCTEANDRWTWNNYNYISGHDEPSLLFYSNKPGSGNSNQYKLNLPTDPPTAPAHDGTGGTWSFMLHPAFWFGMALCDDQSAPNPGAPCKPDTDKNIFTSTNPSSPKYLGNTPGTAFMEMQFYPPGWGGVGRGVSCGPNNHQWCAAMTIDSFAQNSNTGVVNNNDCLSEAGEEYVNFALITKSGNSQGPADPLDQTLASFTTGPDTLEMNNGDKLTVSIHDTAAGVQVVINDLTTGESGSMTASIANGFGHPLFQPNSATCNDQAYAFHPMYSTSSPDTRVLWAAHSYNVAYSDEIGHGEYCNAVGTRGHCATAGGVDSTLDSDDSSCDNLPVVDSSNTTVNPSFIWCLNGAGDNDFDGPSYQNGNWPGTTGATAATVTTPIVFSSPLFKGGNPTGPGPFNKDYNQVAFEADLPRIEGSDFSSTNSCQRHLSNPADPSPGAGCVDPPNGASFYPIYTTTTASDGSCVWQEGGGNIPGTTNNFGGVSGVEYGGLLVSNYPVAGPSVSQRLNNFHNTLSNNPCPAGKKHGPPAPPGPH